MNQRKRKQLAVAAQRAWSAADPRQAGGFVPVGWFAQRNPRKKAPMRISGGLGSIQTIRFITSPRI